MSEYLYVNPDTPDFHCPYCGIGLDWSENCYAYNKEHVRCGECQMEFYATKDMRITYKIEER